MAKKNSNNKIVLGLLGLFVIVKGFGSTATNIFNDSVTNFANKFVLDSIKLRSNIGFSGLSLIVPIRVTVANFNSVGVNIVGINMIALLNGGQIGTIIQQKVHTIGPNDTSFADFDLKVSTLSLGLNIIGQISNLNSLQLNALKNQLIGQQLIVKGQLFGNGGFQLPVNRTIRLA